MCDGHTHTETQAVIHARFNVSVYMNDDYVKLALSPKMVGGNNPACGKRNYAITTHTPTPPSLVF